MLSGSEFSRSSQFFPFASREFLIRQTKLSLSVIQLLSIINVNYCHKNQFVQTNCLVFDAIPGQVIYEEQQGSIEFSLEYRLVTSTIADKLKHAYAHPEAYSKLK